jgi:TonB family protein
MFDRLIESDTADLKPRRRYFIVSSVVVGALFVSAVIFSIYAAEIGLGNDSFDVSMLAPPEAPTPDTQKDPEPKPQSSDQAKTDRPTRIVNQMRVDEISNSIPPVSVVPNAFRSRPPRDFEIAPRETDGPPNVGPYADVPKSGDPSGVSLNREQNVRTTDESETGPPPPPPARTRSIGVVNGIATFLPKPPYPAVAISTGIQGKVDVQVTIDETGKVISAKAASGHPFLRGPAEQAAWKARFTPTLLSKVPVKVTGVIVYNFTRN